MKENVLTLSAAATQRKCKLYCADANSIKKLIISCHGFGGSKENAAAKRVAERMLPTHKDAALQGFDWPCHGRTVNRAYPLTL